MSTQTKAKKIEDTPHIVRVIFNNPKKTGSLRLRSFHKRDEKNKRITRELVKLLDRDGEEFTHLLTHDRTVFDLNHFEDRAIINHLKKHPEYKKHVKILDQEEEAVNHLKEADAKIEAMKQAASLTSEQVSLFARVLGIPVKDQSFNRVRSEVIKSAENDPVGFLSKWDDPDRSLLQTIHEAVDYGIFVNKSRIYHYNDMVIGRGIDQALQWMRENEDMVHMIRKEISSKAEKVPA